MKNAQNITMTAEEIKTYKILIQLGDSPELAAKTIEDFREEKAIQALNADHMRRFYLD